MLSTARGGSAAAAIIPATPTSYALPASILHVYGDNANDLLLPAVGGRSFDSLLAVSAGGLWGVIP